MGWGWGWRGSTEQSLWPVQIWIGQESLPGHYQSSASSTPAWFLGRIRTCSKSGGSGWCWTFGHGLWCSCQLGWGICLWVWQPSCALFYKTCWVCWLLCVLWVRAIWVLPALRWHCQCCGTCGWQSVPLAFEPSQPIVQALIPWLSGGPSVGVARGERRQRRQIRTWGRSEFCRQVHDGVVSQTLTFHLRRPSVLHALALICWMCWFYLRSAWSVAPRYFAAETSSGLSSRVPWRWWSYASR